MADEQEVKVIFSGDTTSLESSAKKATAAIQGIPVQAAKASEGLDNLNKSIQTAPVGVQELQNKLAGLPKSLNNLKSSALGATSEIQDFSGVVSGPGLVGTAALALAVEHLTKRYGSLSNAYEIIIGNATALSLYQQKFNAELAQSGAHVAGEVAELRSLIDVARNESLSRDARTQAINRINQAYPAFHKNLNLETINTNATKVGY
jgi:hypothetical protein